MEIGKPKEKKKEIERIMFTLRNWKTTKLLKKKNRITLKEEITT